MKNLPRKTRLRTPADHTRTKARNAKIQHNREALKRLREGIESLVMLYLIEPDGLKKVWVESPGAEYEHVHTGTEVVVYASKKRKLLRGHLYKEGGCKVMPHLEASVTVDWSLCYGIVVRVEACQPQPVAR